METRAIPCRVNVNGHEFSAIATFTTSPQDPNTDFVTAIQKGLDAHDRTLVCRELERLVEDHFPVQVGELEVAGDVRERDGKVVLTFLARPKVCTNREHFAPIAEFELMRQSYPTMILFGDYRRIVDDEDSLGIAIAELLSTPEFGAALAAYRDA